MYVAFTMQSNLTSWLILLPDVQCAQTIIFNFSPSWFASSFRRLEGLIAFALLSIVYGRWWSATKLIVKVKLRAYLYFHSNKYLSIRTISSFVFRWEHSHILVMRDFYSKNHWNKQWYLNIIISIIWIKYLPKHCFWWCEILWKICQIIRKQNFKKNTSNMMLCVLIKYDFFEILYHYT